MSVSISNLTKIFGKQKAIDHISFDVQKGEIVGFLGPNGAGKSTTMKIITGYLPPTEGKVEVCGEDVRKNSLEIRKNIGYLPEHNPLYEDMYIREHLAFVGSLHQMKGNILKKRVDEMVELCGLVPEQNKKISMLSKGYRQRVGLAQALIHNPPVLILDEPTTGLDPNQILEIRQVIKNIGADKSVIFSTHIMQEVQALCNRVVIINAGKIVANSTVENLQSIQKSNNILLAEFDKSIDISLLQSIEGIFMVKQLEGFKYEIHANKEQDIRGTIFKFATDNNLILLEMKQLENTMENIFKELTKLS